MKGLDYFDREFLIGTFLYQINNARIAVGGCDKILLVWDRAPYHKIVMLEDYKGDRWYATEEDLDESNVVIDDVKKQVETETDPIKKLELKVQLQSLNEAKEVLENELRLNKIKRGAML